MTIAYQAPGGISDLARHGDAPAIVLDDRILSHRELDDLVEDRTRTLGTVRRLVMIECAPDLEPLVTYLAALRGGHPALLVPARDGTPASTTWDRLVASYRPDVLLGRSAGGWELTELRTGTAHELHPDLALLLGTSGSTGTPKLVRLSHENLRANAAAIGAYLGLDENSRAATTLPLQYCYGLSVVNSHLLAGGSLWLTSASVVDPGFWDDFVRVGATSFAGVPYTFDLLEAAGTDWTATPGLRQVTQAGGRMAPDRVRDLALRTARDGVELFVMYGQTEATARMAYLPPHLAKDRPGCIGIPIDGGEFRIDDGELVYAGPNVMLGYAESPADLALGATLTELRTGDLAIQHDDGLYEIVGRKNRIAKIFGTRLDLDHVERLLAEHGIDARTVVEGDRLTVMVVGQDAACVGDLVTAELCLPRHVVAVHPVEAVPLTANGKTDYAALARLAAPAPVAPPADVRAAFAGIFGDVGTDDSFTTLRGDSLTYVELYVRLERVLGRVPPDWPTRTIADLQVLATSGRPVRPRRRWAALETPVVLRAAAIVMIVLGHTDVVNVLGGAHVLLAVLGYNVARFALGNAAPERTRALLGTVREIVVPCSLWIVGVIVVTGSYRWSTAVYLNGVLHPTKWTVDWRLWFLEAAVWSLLALAAVTRLGPVDRALRRAPNQTAWVALGLALALRVLTPDVGVLSKYSISDTVWLVALGWVVAVSRTTRERILVSAAVPLCLFGFFPDDLSRALVTGGGVLLLTWVPSIPVPRVAQGLVSLVASASLFIYLTHWQVYVPLKYHSPWAAFAASMCLGVAVHLAYTAGRRALTAGRGRSAGRGASG